ncbi:MAG: SAM-dependent methyltransferase, partial [Opitutus sp.]
MCEDAGMSFEDHFSTQAATYARARPTYPPALFAELARLAPGNALAWDAGTGNGQAAVALAAQFE